MSFKLSCLSFLNTSAAVDVFLITSVILFMCSSACRIYVSWWFSFRLSMCDRKKCIPDLRLSQMKLNEIWKKDLILKFNIFAQISNFKLEIKLNSFVLEKVLMLRWFVLFISIAKSSQVINCRRWFQECFATNDRWNLQIIVIA